MRTCRTSSRTASRACCERRGVSRPSALASAGVDGRASPGPGPGPALGAAASAAVALQLLVSAPDAFAAAVPANKDAVTPLELAKVVEADMVQRSYLITGDLTKAVFADDASFADGNNDFGPGLDSWVAGTKRLFVSDRCKLKLTGEVVYDETARTLTVPWRQVDVFRLPGAPHTPVFTGFTTLTLGPSDDEGHVLVVDHTETWDQTPSEILRELKFFDPAFDPPGFDS